MNKPGNLVPGSGAAFEATDPGAASTGKARSADVAVRTACPYCGVGCGVLAKPDGSVAGDPDHPANFGRLCSKGSALGETLGLESRLLAPRIDGVDTDWDTALDLVAQRFSETVAAHGPDSTALYVSGQLLTEDYYVANKLMKGFIGSSNIDTNSRLCMASTVAGHRRAFGTDTVPGLYEDLEQADLVVLVGSNLAWCHPVLYQRLAAAKAERGTTVVTIDPRRTATTDLADMHLGLTPGSDVALFNGLLTAIADGNHIAHSYTDINVEGLEAAIHAARSDDPAVTGLDASQLDAFYRLWIGTEKVVTVFSQGVNQSSSGSDKVNSILNCHLATGRIGLPGMGPLSVTGQPNAMGGREVGGLANMLACHLDIENAAHRDAVRDFWSAPTIAQAPGKKAVDMFDAVARGEIKALWIIHTNPAVSMPEADVVRAAIEQCDFVAVSEITAASDTARLADVLLPASAWGEKDGTVTNSERCISRQRPFRASPGAARPDWDILADVARRMGFVQAFDYETPAEIFREHAALSGIAGQLGRDFDISALAGISDAAYD
ncbi:MAG: molybdopterin-dependent oxidoreductase, partial [Pseudomonadota bacterium]